ncbi:hypothetical protein AS156_28535 [Bradyrhizobium macuxiense]|uniref:Uncharacterized protein n=1 Tax=Bradyrhizobium macuxiense TaxID=1755647 RepID=A0A109JYP8_9BRAD|nr:hypothetical protein [Bradyrhizobium macuxiense]KWV48910.1 hypothetical protein AS156_01400 [Bradyrhizobium macuxiense]KWV57465.1 hypothetical protein AS156_39895 [Bradyrhizobium macuxiense]KWV58433.1 hypothetical protein AS156_34680 [Bradyrhizobium macuxiense]KWV59728.1 hypothetical protein AS156_30575 [Bradyrhizobium macuxiense]KWV60528.1 hypothetical protein AS156_28575 [Bradyrhizobium macuxiense]
MAETTAEVMVHPLKYDRKAKTYRMRTQAELQAEAEKILVRRERKQLYAQLDAEIDRAIKLGLDGFVFPVKLTNR